jgi:hypothetical protein
MAYTRHPTTSDCRVSHRKYSFTFTSSPPLPWPSSSAPRAPSPPPHPPHAASVCERESRRRHSSCKRARMDPVLQRPSCKPCASAHPRYLARTIQYLHQRIRVTQYTYSTVLPSTRTALPSTRTAQYYLAHVQYYSTRTALPSTRTVQYFLAHVQYYPVHVQYSTCMWHSGV